VIPSIQLLKVPVRSNRTLLPKACQIKAWLLKMNGENRTRIGRMIHIPENPTDTSPFCLPVQTKGVDGFKLALHLTQ
jgi:hypothetical protein